MKLRTVIIIVASIYSIFFLIGPWHYYDEVKHRAVKGKYLKDNINKVISAHWDEQKLIICLQGRIDGEPGEIFFELESEKIKQKSIGKFEIDGEFREIINLSRSEYSDKCKPIKNDNYITVKDYFQISNDSYSLKTIKKQMSNSVNGSYILLKLSRDIGYNRYKNKIAIYEKNNSEGRLAWFALKGVYHKNINPYIFDYVIAVVKDYLTMFYQWYHMIEYLRGGIG